MISKLQRKTLIPAQIVGYAFTLLVGVAIVLLTFQLYTDVKPLLTQQPGVFKAHTVTVSKNISIKKSLNKESVYFTDEQLEEIESQTFVKKISKFRSSSFSVSAYISISNGQRFSTELFFESVPDDYLDVDSEAWSWDSTSTFLPIVIPEDYLSLYNFGFAESQSLPVVSQNSLEQIKFTIRINGNGRYRQYDSRIVGFSGKINSILVPESFLKWANERYGTGDDGRCSRLLIEFSDASDSRITPFFEHNNLNVNKNDLEQSKMAFFIRFGLLFLFVIAVIIIVLSMAFIVMSLNLIVQKNRDLFINLYNIGYTPAAIAKFYQYVISCITVVDLILAVVIALRVRVFYMARLSTMFEPTSTVKPILIAAALLVVILLVVYNFLIRRTIRMTVAGSSKKRNENRILNQKPNNPLNF